MFKYFIDKHIPKVKIKTSTEPPWFDSEIHKLCREKEIKRKKFKRTQNLSDLKMFKSCRENLKKKIKELYKNYGIDIGDMNDEELGRIVRQYLGGASDID